MCIQTRRGQICYFRNVRRLQTTCGIQKKIEHWITATYSFLLVYCEGEREREASGCLSESLEILRNSFDQFEKTYFASFLKNGFILNFLKEHHLSGSEKIERRWDKNTRNTHVHLKMYKQLAFFQAVKKNWIFSLKLCILCHYTRLITFCILCPLGTLQNRKKY